MYLRQIIIFILTFIFLGEIDLFEITILSKCQ